MPNYEQSKKEKFYKLKKAYEDEIARAYPLRDDNLCDVYRRDLVLFLSSFNTELQGAKLATLPGTADEGLKPST